MGNVQQSGNKIRFRNLMFQNLFWRICVFFTSLVLNILIARIFGPSMSGEFNFFVAASALILLITTFNLDSSVIYFSGTNKISLVRLTSLVTFYIFLVAVLFFFLSFRLAQSNFELYRN